MEARAQARFIRVTPMKARRVVDVIRGMNAEEAVAMLRFAPQGAAEPVRKVLESAIANADDLDGTPSEDLVITEAYVDDGPTLRRFRPRAQGRAYRIRKRTCHITVVVDEKEHASDIAASAGKRTSASNIAASAGKRTSASNIAASAGKRTSAAAKGGTR